MCKRQVEFIAFLSKLEQELPSASTRVSLVMDNLKMYQGNKVLAWFAAHHHFVCHFVPVHYSWMNQVEQRFSILQRKRLRIIDFSSLDHLAERLMAFVA